MVGPEGYELSISRAQILHNQNPVPLLYRDLVVAVTCRNLSDSVARSWHIKRLLHSDIVTSARIPATQPPPTHVCNSHFFDGFLSSQLRLLFLRLSLSWEYRQDKRRMFLIWLSLIALFMLLTFAMAQTLQPLHVWSSKPMYMPGDFPTVLWDKSGPCVVPGATGTIGFNGPPPTYFHAINELSESTVLSGQFVSPYPFRTGDEGNWTVIIDVLGPNGCTSEGSVSVQDMKGPSAMSYTTSTPLTSIRGGRNPGFPMAFILAGLLVVAIVLELLRHPRRAKNAGGSIHRTFGAAYCKNKQLMY